MSEVVVSLPPTSASASASTSTTPRALLRSLVRFPKYCIRNGNKGAADKRREEEEEEGEFVGPTIVEKENVPPPVSPLREDDAANCEEVVAVTSGTTSFFLI